MVSRILFTLIPAIYVLFAKTCVNFFHLFRQSYVTFN